MKPTKEQIEAAIHYFSKRKVEYTTQFRKFGLPVGREIKHFDDVLFSLKLAAKIMGEPSEGMNEALLDNLVTEEIYGYPEGEQKDAIKAMISQAIKEVMDE